MKFPFKHPLLVFQWNFFLLSSSFFFSCMTYMYDIQFLHKTCITNNKKCITLLLLYYTNVLQSTKCLTRGFSI